VTTSFAANGAFDLPGTAGVCRRGRNRVIKRGVKKRPELFELTGHDRKLPGKKRR
jgi:hypothetical protein